MSGPVLPGEVWKVLALPCLLSSEVKGNRALRKGQGGAGPTELALAAPEPSLNFSERGENTTWVGFTLAGATENAPPTSAGFARASLPGPLEGAVCLASVILTSSLRYGMVLGPTAAQFGQVAQTVVHAVVSLAGGSFGKLGTLLLGPLSRRLLPNGSLLLSLCSA